MKRFIEGQERSQVTLLPECLDDYIGEDNSVRVVDAFVDELDLEALGFEGATAAATGRPSYHPSRDPARCRRAASRRDGSPRRRRCPSLQARRCATPLRSRHCRPCLP
jgi:hypothetical protein